MSYAIGGLDMERVEIAPDGLTPYSWRGPCRVGGCTNPATDPHHVIPRGRLGGPVRYVLIDGEVWANVAGICRLHHERITDGRSYLEWHDEPVRGWWYVSKARSVPLLPLGSAEACIARGGRGCPHCGQSWPKPRPFEMRRRERAPFVIRAPVDQGEDGPAMLAALAEQIAEQLGLERPESDSARYHAVTVAMTAAVLHPDTFDGLKERINGTD